jgi:hypothetical protein
MKISPAFAAVLLASVLLTSGCASRITASGGRETTVLGGAVTVATQSFQPVTPATIDTDMSKLASNGDPSGTKVSLLWGVLTFHNY